MASAISATAGLATLRIDWIDIEGKTPTQTITLSPDLTDTEAALTLDYLRLMSYAGQSAARLVRGFNATGLNATPANEVYPSCNMRLLFTFSHVDPDNATKTLYRTVSVPAYRKADDDTIVTADGKPNTSNATAVAPFIAMMQLNLAGVSHSGVAFDGNWTYEASRSGTISIGGDMEA